MTKMKGDDPPTLSDEAENKITDGFKVSWQTAVNLAVFTGLLIVTGWETYKCFVRLMESPTYTSFRLAAQKEVDFPSLTFCPIVTEAFKEDVLTVALLF